MERKSSKVLLVLLLISSAALHADGAIRYRSESFNNARKDAGLVNHQHLWDKDSWYGTFDITVGGGRSFRAHQIADCLFGCFYDCCGLKIQGSKVEDRDENALLADYFYLPTDYSSEVRVKPQITNAYINFDLYLGLDKWLCNTYFRVYGPLTWTKWDLNLCENVINPGANDYPCGYFTPGTMARDLLNESFKAYACGAAPAPLATSVLAPDATQDVTIIFDGLKAARLGNCDNTKLGFADLRLEFGWNFINDEDYLFGLYLTAAAPTGNRISARSLFAPVVGNGHHWELGGGVNAKWIFWRCDDEDRHFGLYLDAMVTHLFKATEGHTLNLIGKPMSKYMLLQRLGTPIIGDLANSDNVAPTAQFKYEYAPLANLSTIDAKVSIGAQADVAAWFNYSGRCFSWDIGYEFFGQSCSKISRSGSCSSSCSSTCGKCTSTCSCGTSLPCYINLCDSNQENTWALKGDAQIFGFDTHDQDLPADCVLDAIPLSATQSEATITHGTNGTDMVNSGVDDAELAFGDRSQAGGHNDLFNTVQAGQAQINTSFEPIFVSCCDLDFCSTNRPLSNKVWTHLSYTWDFCEYRPYLGIGGEVEFGTTENDGCGSSCGPCRSSSRGCSISCTDCFDCGVSQWALWIKGGVSFE